MGQTAAVLNQATQPSGLFLESQELLYCANVDLMFAIIYCPVHLCKIKAGDCDETQRVYEFRADAGSLIEIPIQFWQDQTRVIQKVL